MRLLVIGAGLIGARHIKIISQHQNCELAGIVDPYITDSRKFNVPIFESIDDVDIEIDGAVIATPTSLHNEHATQAANRGWHVLIEKPVAGTLDDADKLIAATHKAGVQTLVGHHRRYHASLQHLKKIIAEGAIGAPVVVNLIWAVRKPDEYFQNNWRSQEGSPVMINMVHDLDVLRFVFGEIEDINAMGASNIRQQERTESGIISLRFTSGTLACISFSDTCPSPWGFEAGTDENPNIATTGQDMMWICGTKGSISYPSLNLWSGSNDWSQAPSQHKLDIEKTDPLKAQLDHFIDVINGKSEPLINALDARQTLAAALKIERVLSQNSQKLERIGDKNE
jgi:predicted dehydrogenase